MRLISAISEVVARERWQCRCGSIQVPANWTTYPTSRRRDRGTYWYREYRTRQQERQASCCSLWGAALLRGCKRISRKTYPFVRLADACVYLTHPQEQSRSQPLPHTVLSRKNIPYRSTSFTVPGYKLYRTHQQGIPYSAAKHDVPCNKSSAQCTCKIQEIRRCAV